MQPTNPYQPRGSFTKPDPVAPKAQAKAQAEEEKDTPAASEEVAAKPLSSADEDAVKKALEEREKQIKGYIAEISKDLGITLDNDDIKNYILKGKISKEVILVTGVMKGTLQTLRIEDLQNIDLRMASIRDESKFTPKGLENEEAIIVLSYAWTHADGKSLGETPESRESKIRKMGSLFVERASSARVSFDTLVRLVMQERGLVKK
jgi:hypothetical protein